MKNKKNSTLKRKPLITHPDVFIIESLSLKDEKKSTFDGKILHNYLKLLKKEPIYYYIRTKRELIEMAKLVKESKYRYLYISCHGNRNILRTTLDEIPFDTFSDIFKGALTHRRIFISGCELGNSNFATSLFNKDTGIYSLTAPVKPVYFTQMLPFWSTFFYITSSFDVNKMKGSVIHPTLQLCSNIFNVDMAHFYRKTQNGELVEKKFDHADMFSEEELNKILELKKLE